MPLYERVCQTCNHTTETLEPYTDTKLKDCPSCGSLVSMDRVIARTSFTLSGSGWCKDSYAVASTSKSK